MVEFTSRLGLAKPSDVGEIVDVNLLNNNADAIDLYAAGPFICTSTTRPSNPYEGMQIWETDTKTLLIRDNVAAKWQVVFNLYKAYTPTLAGVTIGNGTISGRYARVGDTVHVDTLLVLGSTSSVTGSIFFGVPTDAKIKTASYSNGFAGSATFGTATARQSGGNRAVGVVGPNDADTVRFFQANETAATGTVWNNTVPFSSWGSGTEISASFAYEAT